MRIAVLNNWVPFLRGGAEHLAEALTRKLQEYGHEAVLVRVPFRWTPPDRIPHQILACRCVRLKNIDRAIALKFPAYCVPHENKFLWLLHQFRQAYDLWGTPLQDLPNSAEGVQVRKTITHSDNIFLRECRKIYTNSHITGDRLRRYNGIASEVLFPPLLESAHLSAKTYGEYVFLPGRITSAKRQYLAVEAMRYVTTGVTLVIAGEPETPSELAKLQDIIRDHRLADRVQVIPRFISEEEKAVFLGHALACGYFPYDEDSYGYVTLEACHAERPVITCSDSGGILILIKDGVSGLVTEPDPRALAEAMDRLFLDRNAARRMGQSGHEQMLGLKITWQNVIEKLTA